MKIFRFFSCFLTIVIVLYLHSSSLSQDYFQQQVDYEMDITIDDSLKKVNAEITMTYFNRSENNLEEIYMHYYPNAYLNDKTAYAKEQIINKNLKFYFSDRRLKGNIKFYVEDVEIDYSVVDGNLDVLLLKLPEPIKSSSSLKISAKFEYIMPEVFSRMGYENHCYYLTQWYPKPAVYDVQGWHYFPYYNMGEFYSEYGDYSVRLDVPCDFKVASTGFIEDAYERDWMLSAMNYKKCDNGRKVLSLEQKNVHDFAIACSPEFSVEHDTINIENRIIDIYTYELGENDSIWKTALNTTKQALLFMSKEVGPYQYTHFSTVGGALEAGAGMEYPALTILAKSFNYETLSSVIVHEVAHNWFYGMLGSNERRDPFIDEGLTSFYEQKYKKIHGFSKDIPRAFTGGTSLNIDEFLLVHLNKQKKLRPLCNHSKDFTDLQYYAANYLHTPHKFRLLESYIGVNEFRMGMQRLFANKKNQHIDLNDIRASFANSSKNVDWFFDHYLCDEKFYNYDIEYKNGSLYLSHNVPYEIPISYRAIHNDIVESKLSDPFINRKNIEYSSNTTYQINDSIHFDEDYSISQYGPKNNLLNVRIRPRIGIGINQKSEEPIFILPSIAYNAYDGVMLGFLFHNITLPGKRLEFQLLPLYGFKQKKIAGLGEIKYNVWCNKIIDKIEIGTNIKKFAYAYDEDYQFYNNYLKISGELNITKEHSKLQTSRFQYKYIVIHDHYGLGISITDKIWDRKYRRNTYNLFNYSYKDDNPINNQLVNVDFHISSSTSRILLNYEYSHTFQNRFIIDFKFFGGIINRGSAKNAFNEIVSGNKSSLFNNDYLFEDVVIGRTHETGFLSHQYQGRDLDLKTAINLPFGNKAISTEIGLKLPYIPVRPFVTLATSFESGSIFEKELVYTAGLNIPIITDRLEIHIPFLYSENLRDIYNLNDIEFTEQILWEIKLKDIDLNTVYDLFFN